MSDSKNPFSAVQFGTIQGQNFDVTAGLSEADLAAQKAQTQLLLNMKDAASAPMGDAMALSPEAMQQLSQQRGLQGAAQEAPKPKGFFGTLWHRFESASSWVYMPAMVGMLSLFGLGGKVMEKNAAGEKVATDVLKRAKANWFAKPFHGLVDMCHWFTEKLVPWGNKISSFVLDKCGVGNLLGRGKASGGLWNGLKRVAEFGPGWNTLGEKRWYSGIARFLKGAGSFCGTGTASTTLTQTGLRFSLRSVLTGMGFAGPIGWLAGGIAAAWTAVSLIKGMSSWFSSSGAQSPPNAVPPQQFVSPSNALANYGAGPQFSTFGTQPPLA
ncbi:MAG: hypothetical protein QE263_06375 [Vampirovibrionales bacterium]|nr:hypothetical protein [Vampirovibrionales bacterium]